jgi:hypothetical protein
MVMDRTSGTAVGAAAEIDDRHDDEPPRDHTWDLVAAVAGLVFFALLVASFFTPDTPSPDDGGAAIAASIAEDRTGHQWSLLLGFLGDITFLVFLAGLWSRLHRAEGRGGMFSGLVAIAGAVFVATIMVSEGLYLALVTGTAKIGDEDPAVFTTLAVLNDWVGAAVLPAGVALFLGIAAAVVSTHSLPHWLGWWAAGVAVLLIVSLAGVFEEDVDEGIVGILGFAGFILMVLWVVAASIVMLLRAGRPAARRHAAATG